MNVAREPLDSFRTRTQICGERISRSSLGSILRVLGHSNTRRNPRPTVVSKLKCPLFVASDLSGLGLIIRRRDCGKVGIPPGVAGFPSKWKTCFWISTQRLFHSRCGNVKMSPSELFFFLSGFRPKNLAIRSPWNDFPGSPCSLTRAVFHRAACSRRLSPELAATVFDRRLFISSNNGHPCELYRPTTCGP